ncbi:HTH domain-containing protein [Sphingomonas sp. PP-CE-1G-424]|nr:HTH domain-containing protein [Sphingomonas sp. PP-CE-1G-424]
MSLRTIRRDIVTLQAMGAEIDGEAGVGYVMSPGFLLPPLSFTDEELDALVIGAEWVAGQTDPALANAIGNALAKIHCVLAPRMRNALDDTSFYVGSARKPFASGFDLQQCRRALREQCKMRITYRDRNGGHSERTIWPIMLGFEGAKRMVAAWCETDNDFRIFDTKWIVQFELLAARYSRNRRQLVKEWRASSEYPCKSTADLS